MAEQRVPAGLLLSGARWTKRIAAVLVTIFTVWRETHPSTAGARARDVLWSLYLEWHLAVIAVLAVASLVAEFVEERVRAGDRTKLRNMLDTLHAVSLAGVPENERHRNRVTLFKANRQQTLLEPFCRSGTQYQRRIQSFTISDDAEGDNEGIAGKAWCENATAVRTHLPDCPTPCQPGNDRCEQYATEGLLPIEKAARLNVRSRSILATPVRDSRGNRWGVLVLESRRPDGIDDAKMPLVTSMAAAIGQML